MVDKSLRDVSAMLGSEQIGRFLGRLSVYYKQVVSICMIQTPVDIHDDETNRACMAHKREQEGIRENGRDSSENEENALGLM